MRGHRPTDRGIGPLLEEVARALPGGGELRTGQVEMAHRITRAIEDGRHLVVQAGTGTGKSLAYLLAAVQSGRRVVVATATKALQDQLAKKDLPFLAQQQGPRDGFTFAVLKGRSNYLCRQRAVEVGGSGAQRQIFEEAATSETSVLDSAGEEPDSPELESLSGFGSQIRRILEWSEHTATGDRADLEFEPHARVWASLSVGPRECPGAFRCPSGSDCFAEHARAVAAASDIVVVNTHLYATHVASGGAVLPDHEVLILDEAHAVEEVMTSGLGLELAAGRLRALAVTTRGLLLPADSGRADALGEVAEQLDVALRPMVGRRMLSGERTDADRELERVLGLAHSRTEAVVAGLRHAQAGPGGGGRGRDDDDDTEDTGRRTRALLAAGHLIDDISEIQAAGDDQVAWVEAAGQGGRALAIRLAPVEIGPVLAERLWPEVTGVLTSATMPPLVEQALGLPASETDRVDVGSPFPYESCALLYCPTDLPDRRSPTADQALQEELRRLIVAAGGRTLALFTSWRAMRSAVDALRPVLEFKVLAQNDLPKRKLVESFSDEESACLFATMSFWQGVDVPGATLSMVAIDRLPFPRPDDPLLQARRDRAGERAFGLVDLPRAATLLAQGAGRLIRSSTDRGVVAVLDRRLATAGYGRSLRGALPPMRFTTRREDVLDFLSSMGSHRPARSERDQ